MCIGSIMVGILFGQEADTVEVHPCDSPLLEQMKGDEKPSLKLSQRLAYTINVIKCRFSERGKNAANLLDVRNKKMAYKDAQQFKSFSSTCAYCAAVMVFVFYLSTIF
mgnify:FL=1